MCINNWSQKKKKKKKKNNMSYVLHKTTPGDKVALEYGTSSSLSFYRLLNRRLQQMLQDPVKGVGNVNYPVVIRG